MLKNILFYAIILFVTVSMQSCCCNSHMRKENNIQYEKSKSNTNTDKHEMSEEEITEWVMDDDWQ